MPLRPRFPIPVWNRYYPGERATWMSGTNDVAGSASIGKSMIPYAQT
jgi:hypothetical protein